MRTEQTVGAGLVVVLVLAVVTLVTREPDDYVVADYERAAHATTRQDGMMLGSWVEERVRRLCPGIDDSAAEWTQSLGGTLGVSAGITLGPRTSGSCPEVYVGETIWFARVVRDGDTLRVVEPIADALPDQWGVDEGLRWWQDFWRGDDPLLDPVGDGG